MKFQIVKGEHSGFGMPSTTEYNELLKTLKDGEFAVRCFLNCCGEDEIRDSFQELNKFQKRAARLLGYQG